MSHNLSGDGVREALSMWQEHKRDTAAKPGPDFRAINKKAVQGGLTSSLGQREFRTMHHIPLKQTHNLHCQPTLRCKDMVHGRPSTCMTQEEMRISGKDAHVDMTKLLQNGFADDWILQQAEKKVSVPPKKVLRGPTKASCGHAMGALETMRRHQEENCGAKELFKMPRFQKVGPRVRVGA